MTERPATPATAHGKLVYSVEEAADLLGVGRTFLFRLVATGEIDSFKIGSRRKIHRDSIDGYIGRLRSAQATNAEDPDQASPDRSAAAQGAGSDSPP